MDAILELWENGWGLDVVLWFQMWRTPLIETLLLPFDFLGNATAYMLIGPFIYWSVDNKLGRQLVSVVLFASWSNYFGKQVFARPRPFNVSSEVVIHESLVTDSYGLPSGHTQVSTVFWGITGLEIKRKWVTVLAVAMFTITGISRVALGVHYPQDVIAGYLLAGITIAAFYWLRTPVTAWWIKQSMPVQILLITAITALMIVIYPVLVPASNVEQIENVLTPTAAFFGANIGMIFERRFLGFQDQGTWKQRGLRYLLGIVVLFAIAIGLDVLFGTLEPAYVLRFIRYGLVGLWISLGAPWAFIKVGLAKGTTT